MKGLNFYELCNILDYTTISSNTIFLYSNNSIFVIKKDLRKVFRMDKKSPRVWFNRPKKNVKLRKMYVMFNPEVKVRSTNLNVCQQVTKFKLDTHRIRHIETQ